MKLENKIQKEVIDYLKKNRIYHFRFQAQVNLNGIPDIIALYKGYMLGIELKKEDGSNFEAAVWPGLTHFPDVLNPAARAWFGQKYDSLLSQGIDAFWNDDNQPQQ